MAFGTTVDSSSKTYVTPRVDSAILEADDFLAQRDIMKGIYDNWSESSLIDMLELTDRYEISKARTFYHYENNLLYRSVAIASVIAGGSAATCVITLTADSYTTEGGATRSPLKAGDIIWLAQGVMAYVTAKSSVTPTSGVGQTATGELNGTPTGTSTRYTLVRRNGSSDDLNALAGALVTSGARVAIPSNANAEGSYQPVEGYVTKSDKFSGQMQIFKQHAEITGTADALHEEVEYAGSTYRWNRQVPETLLKDKGDKNFALMYSPGGSFTTSGGSEVRLTMGLEGYVKTLGHNYSYSDSSGFALADLDAIANKLNKIKGGKEYFWFLGHTLRGEIEEIIREFTGTGSITYNTWGKGDSNSKKLDLGINSFYYKGVTFHMMEIGLHPEVDGLEIFDYDKTGFLMPGESQPISFVDGEGYLQRMRVPSARIKYLQQSGGQSRRFKSWEGGPKENLGRDVQTYDCLSELGLQMVGLRKFIRVYPA